MKKAKGPVIVAVDGPAGSGKSSICERVAQKLEFAYVNTGAIYRAIGFLASELSLSQDDEAGLCDVISQFKDNSRWHPVNGDIYYKEKLLTPFLYSEKAGLWASNIAKLERVREFLLPVQQNWALSAEKGALLDGRDIATVVFPDADVKIFLTASPETRARRRQLQLQEKYPSKPLPDLESLTQEMRLRDQQDSERTIAPLKVAEGARILDSSDLNLNQTIEAMISMIRDNFLAPTGAGD